MQDIIQMCSSFDASKSTKGASKLRRDLINTEIGHLRDLLPLPASTRQRLSQLQLMALVCVYVRKANYFQQVFKRHDLGQMPTPNIGFSKAMNGFLMMMTQNGKLLYISDNAAEYLGHSMEDLLIHGDSVYDIIDKQDHQAVQAEMGRPPTVAGPDDTRLFLCRMNVSRNARRQMRFGDQKVILVQGHFVSYLPLCTRNEPVLIATCTPVAMPETRECVVQGATNIFTTIHNMDMKFVSVDKNGEFYLGYSRQELQNVSWYQLLHWDFMRDAQAKHRLITQSEQDRSCILLIRLQRRNGDWLWIHCVLQVKDATDAGQQPVIVCTNQILSEREAHVMRANSWLYHYYLVQSKLQYGMTYETQQTSSRSVSSPYYNPLMTSPSPSCGTGIGDAPLPLPLPAHQHHPQFHPIGIGHSQPHPLTTGLASPLASPHAPYPHTHPHAHLYPHVVTPVLENSLHPTYHFPLHQSAQQHASQSGNGATSSTNPHYTFTPPPGTHHYPGLTSSDTLTNSTQEFRPAGSSSFSIPPESSQGVTAYTHHHGDSADINHTQTHIKTETDSTDVLLESSVGYSTNENRSELGGYQVKIETKSSDLSVEGIYDPLRGGIHHVKQEADQSELQEESSSPPSPPRKKLRAMATPLPNIATAPYTPNDHQDWPRNRSDYPSSHTYTQVWANGWINTSYPVGITQLEHHSDASYDGQEPYGPRDDESFSSLGVLVAARTLSAQQFQRRVFSSKGQMLNLDSSIEQMASRRYMESVQRVPDVTTVPELSPLGYVLTPAPTPPDIKEGKSTYFTLDGSTVTEVFSEQCVPVSEPDLTNTGQLNLTNNEEVVSNLRPTSTSRVYVVNVPHALPVAMETACDSVNPTPPIDYQTPMNPQDPGHAS